MTIGEVLRCSEDSGSSVLSHAFVKVPKGPKGSHLPPVLRGSGQAPFLKQPTSRIRKGLVRKIQGSHPEFLVFYCGLEVFDPHGLSIWHSSVWFRLSDAFRLVYVSEKPTPSFHKEKQHHALTLL